jgi:hypothetical protein
MRRLGFALVSVVASLVIAACTTNTTTGGPTSSGGPAGNDSGTPGTGTPTDGGPSETLPPPPASTAEANVDIGGTCPAFAACGGSPSGTYDYAGGCLSEVFAAAKAQCPTLDTSGAKVTVRGSLHFVGNALTRDLVSTTSGTIIVPAACTAGQCSAVAAALKPGFDTVTCTGTTSCTCTVKQTATTSNATTFSVAGDTLTTADGDSYSVCVQGSSFKYEGKSTAAEDGVWDLKKR